MCTRARVSALVLTALFATSVLAAAQSPALTDVAKKEEDRRKAIAAPAKVLTNGDLKPVPTVGSASSQGGDTAAKPAEKAADAAAKPAADATAPADAKADAEKSGDKAADKAPAEQGEAFWRGRITAAQSTLDRHKLQLDGLQSQINALNGTVLSIDDPYRKQQVSDQRFKVQHEIDLMQKQLQDDTKAVAGIQEEARRAGVPPGWLR